MDQEFANLCQNYDWHCIRDPGHGSYLAVLRRIGRKLKTKYPGDHIWTVGYLEDTANYANFLKLVL